jgi:hypothetical protein
MHTFVVSNIYWTKKIKQTQENENKSSVWFEILMTGTVKLRQHFDPIETAVSSDSSEKLSKIT